MSIIYDALNKVEEQGRDCAPAPGADSVLSASKKTVPAPGLVSQAARSRPPLKYAAVAALAGSLMLSVLITFFARPVSSGSAAKPRTGAPFSAPAASSTVDAAQAFANMIRPVAIETAADKPAYILQGVIYDDENPLALINGKKVGLGEAIAGARVVTISGDGVELANGNTTIFLPLE